MLKEWMLRLNVAAAMLRRVSIELILLPYYNPTYEKPFEGKSRGFWEQAQGLSDL